MNNLLFRDDNHIYTIRLSGETYEQMIFYSDKANPYETGGVLVGNYSADQTTANIIQITLPPKESRHHKFSFHRRTIGLMQFLDSMWNQGQYYLGEWHYHPNSSPIPSNTDLKQMSTLSKSSKLKCPEPIMIIIGGSTKEWKISAGIYVNDKYISLKCENSQKFKQS